MPLRPSGGAQHPPARRLPALAPSRHGDIARRSDETLTVPFYYQAKTAAKGANLETRAAERRRCVELESCTARLTLRCPFSAAGPLAPKLHKPLGREASHLERDHTGSSQDVPLLHKLRGPALLPHFRESSHVHVHSLRQFEVEKSHSQVGVFVVPASEPVETLAPTRNESLPLVWLLRGFLFYFIYVYWEGKVLNYMYPTSLYREEG
jgi:hypothetical protein